MRRKHLVVAVALCAAMQLASPIPAQSNQPQIAVPGASELTKNDALVDELFGARLEDATSSDEMRALAAELIETADATEGDHADLSLLLWRARDLLADIGDVNPAFAVATALARWFRLDAMEMTAQTLHRAASNLTDADDADAAHRTLREESLILLDQAAESPSPRC